MAHKGNVLLLSVTETCIPTICKEYIDFKSKTHLKTMQDMIKCDTITSASCWGSEALMERNIVMIGDDKGLFVSNPQPNLIASLLYGYLDHGQALVGNFLVLKYNDDGENVDLTADDMALVFNEIDRLLQSVKKFPKKRKTKNNEVNTNTQTNIKQ